MALKQTVAKVNASFLGDEPNAGVKGFIRALAAGTDSDALKSFERPQDTAE